MDPRLQRLPEEAPPKHLRPMLARPGSLPENAGQWGYEIKWDGVRVLAYADEDEWSLQSRRLEDVTERYPELEELGQSLGRRSVVLDGEVVALDQEGRPSFQLLQSRMGLTSAAAVASRRRQTPVDYVIFDLLHLDGRCVRDLSYAERRGLLAGLNLEGPRWRTPPHRVDGGPALLEAARRQGLEGIVAKRLESPYCPGQRTRHWIKARVWKRQEFVIGGWIPGEGRRTSRVGSLLLGYWDSRPDEARQRGAGQRLIYAGGVGSGLKEVHLDRLTRELAARRREDSPFDVGAPKGPKARYAVFCEPELVCEVSWTQWTNEGTLRQPAFKGMRDDKDPRDVVREQ